MVSPGLVSASITAPLACAPRMRLHVGEAAVEQLLGALDRQRLDRVGGRAALIITPARIAFGIFVGQHRALRLEHGAADDILRRDQLDLVLLAVELGGDGVGDRRIRGAQRVGEEAVGLDVARRLAALGGRVIVSVMRAPG